MERDECKLCGCWLEDMEYGHAVRNDRAPYGLDVCFNCLKELKKELEKTKVD